jgi:DHA1 family bicyclomycin/chloramphenicol resistance-like MFS transporter
LPKRGTVIDSGEHLSKRLLLGYVVLLALSMSLIPFTIDPYLPAFPAIGQFFGVTNGVVQASFTGVTLGLAIGQLILGPLSDAFGRRPLMLMAIAGYVVAIALAFLAPSIELFIAARFLMGFFSAGADVIGRAIIRDLYRGQAMQRMLAKTYLIQSIAPIAGPIVGAQMSEAFGWQAIFLLFGLISLALLLLLNFILFETLPVALRRSSTPMGLARGYLNVMRDRVLIGLIFYSAMQLSALFLYLNFTPFVYQQSFGISQTDYGFWLALNGAASYIGVQVGAYVARFFKGQWILAVTAIIGVGVGIGLLLNAGGEFWITQALFFIQLFIFGAAITIIPTIALYNHGSEAGTATSLMGVFSFTFTTILSFFYFLISSADTRDLGVAIGTLFGLSLVSLIVITRPWLVPDLRKPDVV